jgi:hypothetical protein
VDEAKAAIRKFDVLIDMANAAGADITDAKLSLLESVTSFDAGDIDDVFKKIVETRAQLDVSIRSIGKKDPRRLLNRLSNYLEKNLKFVWPMYGFWPLLDATFFLFFYAILLAFWSNHYFAQIIISYFKAWNVKPQGFGVPIWTVLFAGIGACIQIMVNVTNDIKTNGYVEKVRRMWFYLLPIVGPVFGFIAYVLLYLGFLSLGTITAEQLGKATFSVILVCFLAGYSTDWFMQQLGTLISQSTTNTKK